MANPVTGYDGTITIGSSPVNVTKCRKWTHTGERDSTEQGPWIGDSAKVTTVGGKLGTLELEGDIIIGGDAGVDDIKDAFENGTTPTITVTQEDGYAVAYAAGAAYTAFSLETDANGTQTWKATISGAYTISQDS